VSIRSVLCRGVVGLSLGMATCLAAQAQSSPLKGQPRLPPTPSQAAQIPAGTDTGSPSTSGSLPLGTPVPPNGTTDRGDQAARSAAARAAARPDPLTRTGAPLKVPPPTADAAVIQQASRPASAPAPQKASSAVPHKASAPAHSAPAHKKPASAVSCAASAGCG
jgi:hypothetical protein